MTTPSEGELRLRPFFLIGPVFGILGVDGLLDIFDLLPFLVHFIRVQRNVYADPSANGMPVSIAVQVIAMPRIHVAATVTGHSLQEFRNLLRDSISFPCLTRKERWRKSRRSRITGNRRQPPRLTFGEKEDQPDNDSNYQRAC